MRERILRGGDAFVAPTIETISLSAESALRPRELAHRPDTVVDVATCPGSLIVHADGTVAGCTEDDERDGCAGRELRHEGASVRCWVWSLGGCDYCGVQRVGTT